MYYSKKIATSPATTDIIYSPVVSDNADVSNGTSMVDTSTNNEVISGTENNLENENSVGNDIANVESGDVSNDMAGIDDVSIDTNNSLISTMPVVDGSMGFDGAMMDGDMSNDGVSKGLSNTAILSIVIGVCVVLGIVLGIILGKRAANK